MGRAGCFKLIFPGDMLQFQGGGSVFPTGPPDHRGVAEAVEQCRDGQDIRPGTAVGILMGIGIQQIPVEQKP